MTRKSSSARETVMAVESWPLDQPKPYPSNPRKISAKAVDKVAASIEAFGWRQPIVVDGKGVVVAGHTRLLAARQLGLETVPVHVADLTAKQAKAFRLADNRTGEEAAWDEDLLALELEGLGDFDLSLTGFDPTEIEGYRKAREGLTDPDDAPPVEEQAISRRGDLWLLGDHRLLCGDATSRGDVERLMGGEQAGSLFTDPPYGINYDPSWLDGVGRKRQALSSRDTLQGDDGSLDLSFLWDFDRRMVWGFPYLRDAQATGWVVWDKQPGVDKRGIVTPIEMASTTLRKGFDMVRCMWGGYYREAGEERFAHPTQKPIKVIAPFVEDWTEAGEAIFDPFLGSGSTMIACEKTARKCRGMDIAEHYVDVAVRRWQDFAGAEATLDGDGRTFTEIAASRAPSATEAA